MEFRLLMTSGVGLGADEILRNYTQLKDKVKVVDGNVYINIEKVEELMELAELEQEIVVGKDFIGTHEPFIEIYDSYRE